MNVHFKNFRDNKTKLLISYWIMNKGEKFTTCDLSNTSIPLGEDNQILDYGCTFLTQGSGLYQEVGSETIITGHAGDSFNRRPLKAVTITSLEDDSRWCYALHVNSLFTTDEVRGLNMDFQNTPKVITGEQFKIKAGETVEIIDNDNDFYIVNPLYGFEENTISYKTDNDEFDDLKVGKYFKIGKGKTFTVKSTVETYIPKIYLDNVH